MKNAGRNKIVFLPVKSRREIILLPSCVIVFPEQQ